MILHADQERFAGRLAERTGLDVDVVRAWVRAASGPGYRAGHDYLAPGVFPSAELAAEHTASRLEGTELVNVGVMGPLVQMNAIGNSVWPGRTTDLVSAWLNSTGHALPRERLARANG